MVKKEIFMKIEKIKANGWIMYYYSVSNQTNNWVFHSLYNDLSLPLQI